MIIVTCCPTKDQKSGYKGQIAEEEQDEIGSFAEDVQKRGDKALCCVVVVFVVVFVVVVR